MQEWASLRSSTGIDSRVMSVVGSRYVSCIVIDPARAEAA